MLTEGNVVGNQEDWANYITQNDSFGTPFLNRLKTDSKPVNVLYQYQVDAYDSPEDNVHVDGKDWDAFNAAAKNRAELKARIQWFTKTAAVSKLSQDVTNAAGVADEMAREIPRKLTELARDMEATFCSSQAAYEDDGVTGNKTQGVGLWVQNGTSNQLYATPTAFQPAAAQISTANKANTSEQAIQDVLEAMWQKTGSTMPKFGLVGTKLKRRFRDFQFFDPTAAATTTFNTTRDVNRSESGALGGTVDRYESDWGTIELVVSNWLEKDGVNGITSTTVGTWRGYFLHPQMWCLRWNQRPTVYRPEYRGGSYKAAVEALAMLVCKNPIGEGAVKPSDA